jgi:hypothetical protein
MAAVTGRELGPVRTQRGNGMPDPRKEANAPKTAELSNDELDAVSGGAAVPPPDKTKPDYKKVSIGLRKSGGDPVP